MAPDVPELVELVDLAHRGLEEAAVREEADVAEAGLHDWRTWTAMAMLGSLGFLVPPFEPTQPGVSPPRRETLSVMRRVRCALSAALHSDPAAARPYWRSADHVRLVAWRVAVVAPADLEVLTGAAAQLDEARRTSKRASGSTVDEPPSFEAANCSAALRCLRAVLVPVGDPDTLALSGIATGTRRADPAIDEILLDDRARLAHQRVSVRLLEALHAVD